MTRLSLHKYIIRFLSRKLLRNDKGGRTKFGSCNNLVCHLDLKERSKDFGKGFLVVSLLFPCIYEDNRDLKRRRWLG